MDKPQPLPGGGSIDRGVPAGRHSFFQADCRGPAVGVQAFDAGEFLDHGKRGPDRLLVEPHDAGAALELIGAEAGERAPRAAGGQRVAGTRQEIADGDRRVVAKIDRARRADLRQPAFFIGGDERQVLRAERVGDGDAIGEGLHMQQEGAGFQHVADDFPAGKRGELSCRSP